MSGAKCPIECAACWANFPMAWEFWGLQWDKLSDSKVRTDCLDGDVDKTFDGGSGSH